jgi:hypothetical protein
MNLQTAQATRRIEYVLARLTSFTRLNELEHERFPFWLATISNGVSPPEGPPDLQFIPDLRLQVAQALVAITNAARESSAEFLDGVTKVMEQRYGPIGPAAQCTLGLMRKAIFGGDLLQPRFLFCDFESLCHAIVNGTVEHHELSQSLVCPFEATTSGAYKNIVVSESPSALALADLFRQGQAWVSSSNLRHGELKFFLAMHEIPTNLQEISSAEQMHFQLLDENNTLKPVGVVTPDWREVLKKTEAAWLRQAS